MNALRFFGAVAVAAALALGSGCQTYDFEPVEPLAIAQTTQTKTVVAKQLKPDLMLLVDKSGSMNFNIDTSDPNCCVSGSPPCTCGAASDNCPAACKTRMRDLKSAMADFLSNSYAVARMGMTFFPGGPGSCDAPTQVTIEMSSSNDVDAELKAKATEINTAISKLVAGGGTPTGMSLRMLGSYGPLKDANREDFILLLTDGLPNCNSQNVNTCAVPACNCTLANADCGSPGTPMPPACVLGCLDKTASLAEINTLRGLGIRTIVVGFGADTAAGSAADTLNAMAAAGGFARACPNGTNAECGTGNTCDTNTKLCQRKFYQAANGTELAKALDDISKSITSGDPCDYVLDSTPSDPRFLSVIINGVSTPQGSNTWTYVAPSGAGSAHVKFQGDLCTKLTTSDPLHPVKVEFRIVQTM